jgi:hypothetical protein
VGIVQFQNEIQTNYPQFLLDFSCHEQLKKQRKNKITNVFDIKDNLSNQLHQHLGFALPVLMTA